MKTTVARTTLPDLLLVGIDYFRDHRGFFIESWNKRDFATAGLDLEFVQEGHSRSDRRVLRGLHYQDGTCPMGKLVRCTVGAIFDVAVDIRRSSSHCGKWFGIELSADNKHQLYVPPGFAHGFVVLSDVAEVQYKQTGYYTPAAEGTIQWNDATIGIEWPIRDPILSERDRNGRSFSDYLKTAAF